MARSIRATWVTWPCLLSAAPKCFLEASTAGQLPVYSIQSTISQLSRLSRMMSRCLSIFHSVYKCRAAPAALRWAGPTPPCLASCWDRHTQVARFLPSLSGVPNQYLERVRDQTSGPLHGRQGAKLTSRTLHWLWPRHVLPCPAYLTQRMSSSAGSATGTPRYTTSFLSTGSPVGRPSSPVRS